MTCSSQVKALLNQNQQQERHNCRNKQTGMHQTRSWRLTWIYRSTFSLLRFLTTSIKLHQNILNIHTDTVHSSSMTASYRGSGQGQLFFKHTTQDSDPNLQWWTPVPWQMKRDLEQHQKWCHHRLDTTPQASKFASRPPRNVATVWAVEMPGFGATENKAERK